MLVEFSVGNFRSIKEVQTISFVSTGLKSSEKNKHIDTENIVDVGGVNLFKTIGLYGANASGKSNILKAFEFFVRTIKREPSSDSKLSSLCQPFLFQENADESDSFFQIVLIIDNKKYRYGITVRKNNAKKRGIRDNQSNEIITNEWLYGIKEKNNGELFRRNSKGIEKNLLRDSDKIPNLAYQHTLYLTHAAAFDNKGVCKKIRNHVQRLFVTSLDNNLEDFRFISVYYLENPEVKHEFLNLLASFNLHYEDVELDDEEEARKNLVVPRDKIKFKKNYKNNDSSQSIVELNLSSNESEGTKKLFDLAGLLLRIFGYGEPVLVVLDEIDSNFHPSLLKKLIEIFNDKKVNKSNSQLLFSSHDTNLMSPSIMRRDQFYFTEKNENNATRLYSLADLRGVRNDADFAKQYLAGYYGAIPILNQYVPGKE
ncbi:MAG: ATP-binding protein [Chitinophagales bacterium]